MLPAILRALVDQVLDQLGVDYVGACVIYEV